MSSDRTFGLVVGAALAAAGAIPAVKHHPMRWWLFYLGTALAAVGATRPGLLHPLNRLWTGLAKILHRIVSPLVLGAMFFLVITPIALIMRMLKRDALHLRTNSSAPTYWKKLEPGGPIAETMRHPF